jgi:amino acid permease
MTNVTHNFFSMYLSLFLTIYMFRAHRAHHQERQIVSPDDEHDVIETCRELKIKINT